LDRAKTTGSPPKDHYMDYANQQNSFDHNTFTYYYVVEGSRIMLSTHYCLNIIAYLLVARYAGLFYNYF
jgi:hypothetical protein